MRELVFACFFSISIFSPHTMAITPQSQDGTGGLVPPKVKVEPKPVTLEAVDLVKSCEISKQEKARTLLTDEKYLQCLNTAREYQSLSAENLQLRFILEALSENPDKTALQTLDVIAANPLYRESGPRQTLLLMSSVKIRSAPSNIQRFWKDQLKLDAADLNLAVDSLVANGSPEAIKTLEEALLRNEYEPDYVIAWFQDSVLKHRQDLFLLEACERLLRSETWPSDLKGALVEALFDYRPESWYTQENEPPKPPSRKNLTVPARQKLIKIADLALQGGWIDKKRRSKIDSELKGK